jgi:hypothetical protein
MLEFLRGKASDRKLRLFAVACCRRIWGLITHEECRQAILVSELYADGEATPQECEDAGDTASLIGDTSKDFVVIASSCAVGWATSTGPKEWNAATWSLLSAMENSAYHAALIHKDQSPEQAEQANCFRDIFGNPFRPITVNPAWLTSTVTGLARQMYESRDFSPMPILADALQDAGCENADILSHCWGPNQVHVRGCWVVDMLLGQE